ncbi:MAG: DUF2911 domain-containing protein [Blastocatellia bacterium]
MKPYHTVSLTYFLVLCVLALLSACNKPAADSKTSASPAANATTAPDRSQSFSSPRGTAEMKLNGKKITVDYGRPSMHGRKIMGGLVPYDEIWRTGANRATHFTTDADLTIGEVTVPKGTYTLFTLPSAKEWKLIINKQTGQWGTPYKPEYEKTELARVPMNTESLSAPVEQFTILLEPSGSGGVMKLEWEQTRAAVNFTEKK